MFLTLGLGLVVVGGYSSPKGHEFEPQCQILNGLFFAVISCKFVLGLEIITNKKLRQRWPVFKKTDSYISMNKSA